MISQKELENRFTYHKPDITQSSRYESIRGMVKSVAGAIIECTPKCREQSLAITKLEEAVFWANASIARHE